MLEILTDRARKVMQLANQEALRFNHEYIGTEHILLGLVKEGSGVAANVLKNLDINLPKIRLEVEKIVQSGPDMVTMGKLPQTPQAKRVMKYSIEESLILHNNSADTEHLLLGLLREEEGVACQVLLNLGLQLDEVRAAVLIADDFPPEVQQALKELNAQIEQLTQQKEAAVNESDWERAAYLLGQARRAARTKRSALIEYLRRHLADPSWLTANSGTVAAVAQVIDQEHRWENLPILADALEEAGCTDQEILHHCRQPGSHWRSCWVIALLLGKIELRTCHTGGA